MKIVVGHLYPEYLNIYADRGQHGRAGRALRGARDRVRGPAGLARRRRSTPTRTTSSTSAAARIASRRSSPRTWRPRGGDREALAGGAALLAVCGGYQLLGRFYRDRAGAELAGAGIFDLHTVAGERRMIGDVLLECELDPGDRRTLAGFENHAGRTILGDGAQPLGRVVAGFGNDGESGYEGCRRGRALGTYLHGPLLPRNPWLADWLIGQALAPARRDASGARAARRRPRGAGARRRGARAHARGGEFG